MQLRRSRGDQFKNNRKNFSVNKRWVVCARYPGRGVIWSMRSGTIPSLIRLLRPLGQNRPINKNSIRLKSIRIVIETGGHIKGASRELRRAKEYGSSHLCYWAQRLVHEASVVFQWLVLQSPDRIITRLNFEKRIFKQCYLLEG